MNYFTVQIDTLVLGRLLGALVLGQFSMAKGLALRPLQLIGSVANRVGFPVLARAQEDAVLLRVLYLKLVRIVSIISMPSYAILCFYADVVVCVVLGRGWLGVVLIVRLLSVWGAIRSSFNTVGSLLLASGRANLGFWWNCCLMAATALVVSVASCWGWFGVCCALIGLQVILVVPGWLFLVKPCCGAGFVSFVRQWAVPMVLAFCCFSMRIVLGGGVPWLISLVLGLAIYLLVVWRVFKVGSF